MIATATTTVSILRGDEVNGYGDVVDSDTAIHTKIPASIHEQNRRVYLPAEQAYRIIRSYTGRLPSNSDVQKNDRLRDERTGAIYLVTDIADPVSPAFAPDRHVELSRTT